MSKQMSESYPASCCENLYLSLMLECSSRNWESTNHCINASYLSETRIILHVSVKNVIIQF